MMMIFCSFMQKTAYDVRISDWSSDVCTSVLLLFRTGEFLKAHSNGMRFSAWLDGQEEPLDRDYYSVGGGAVLPGAEAIAADAPLGHNVVQPYPFSSGAEMLALGESTGLSIATLVLRNEGAWREIGRASCRERVCQYV